MTTFLLVLKVFASVFAFVGGYLLGRAHAALRLKRMLKAAIEAVNAPVYQTYAGPSSPPSAEAIPVAIIPETSKRLTPP